MKPSRYQAMTIPLLIFSFSCGDNVGQMPDGGRPDILRPDGVPRPIIPPPIVMKNVLRIDNSAWEEIYGTPGVEFQKYYSVDFLSVWASSQSNVYIVANVVSEKDWVPGISFPAKIEGVILHYNGTTFSKMPTNSISMGLLQGIWGNAVDDIWAIGASILHFNGNTWKENSDTGGSNFKSIWGSKPTGMWVTGVNGIGSYSQPAVMEYLWRDNWNVIMTDPKKRFFCSIWGVSKNEMYFGGENGQVVRLHNLYFIDLPRVPTDKIICSLWGTDGNNLYAVDTGGGAFWFNGGVWHPIKGDCKTKFRAVSGSSASDVYLVGHPFPLPENQDESVFHFDGKKWETFPPLRPSYINNIFVLSPSDVYLVGKYNILKKKL